MSKLITVEVAYAKPDDQRLIVIKVGETCTIESVIYQSGILTFFPEIDLTRQKVGIFGKVKQLTDYVMDGDRIEIYRPLIIDPKEARRAKAKKPR